MSIVRDADFNVTTRVPSIEVQDRQLRADIFLPSMVTDGCRGLCIDVSRVHDFHGNAANPSQNGTLRHTDINLVLSHRAQEKIDKYRAGYASVCERRSDYAPCAPLHRVQVLGSENLNRLKLALVSAGWIFDDLKFSHEFQNGESAHGP